jgi:hypothetical protein
MYIVPNGGTVFSWNKSTIDLNSNPAANIMACYHSNTLIQLAYIKNTWTPLLRCENKIARAFEAQDVTSVGKTRPVDKPAAGNGR